MTAGPKTAFVTCIYNGLNGTPFGGRLNRHQMYRDSLAIIAASGVRIFCFVSAAERSDLENFFAGVPNEIVWIEAELTDHPHSREIQRIKTQFPWQFEDLVWRERCVEIMWGKTLMMQRVLETYPEIDRLYWVDAGLASDTLLPSRYRRAEHVRVPQPEVTAFPADIVYRLDTFRAGRLLVLTTRTVHNPPIPASYNQRPYTDACGVVGGLFGGDREPLLHLAHAFRSKCDAIVARNELYPEESILTGLFADHPEWFTAFVFDSWYHEEWPRYDPAVVNFSQFFDALLAIPSQPSHDALPPPRPTAAVWPSADPREQIIACLNVATGRGAADRLWPLLRSATWADFLDEVRAERVSGWVHHALKDKPFVPSRVRSALRGAYRQTGARVAQMGAALSVAVRALNQRGITVVLLKGAALQHQLWTDKGVRPWSDLDLLVAPDEVDAAVQTLAALGYAPARLETTPGTTVAHESELLLEGPGGMLIDLHWSLFDSPTHQYSSRAVDLITTGRQRVDVGGGSAEVLSPEAQLLHLCGHRTLHHRNEGLLWLNDIAQLTVRYSETLDWNRVLTQSEVCALVLPLQRSIEDAVILMGATVPPEILSRIRALTPGTEERRAMAAIEDPQRSMAARLWHDIRTTPRWSARLTLLRSRLVPSWAYMRARYQVQHPLAVALTYPYRWAIGLARPTGDAGGHLSGHTAHTAPRERIPDRDPRRRTPALPSSTPRGGLSQRHGDVGVGAVRRTERRGDSTDAEGRLSGRAADAGTASTGDHRDADWRRSSDDGLSQHLDVSFGGVTCAIRAHDPTAASVAEFLVGPRGINHSVAEAPACTFDISVCDDPAYLQLSRDGRVLSHRDTPGGLAAHLGAEVALTLATHAREGLLFHAAAVAWCGAAVLLPGASGAGKTTLTAHLVSDGLVYLSDELAGFPHGTTDLVGYRRPLGIKTGAWPALERSLTAIPDAKDVYKAPDGLLVRPERLNPVGTVQRVVCRAIVLPQRTPGATPTLTRLTGGAAAAALLASLVNARNLPGHGIPEVARVARTVSVWTLDYDEAAHAVPVLRALLRTGDPAAP